MFRSTGLAVQAALIWLCCSTGAIANSLLDGRVFTGMIGPEGNTDLEDSLHFDDGHFWSDICTRCGFLPGEYTAKETAAGITFQGTLKSESRGRFDYQGLVRDDGTIQVSIRWERRRWYWTSSRDIVFSGHASNEVKPLPLDQARLKMSGFDPEANPQCARF